MARNYSLEITGNGTFERVIDPNHLSIKVRTITFDPVIPDNGSVYIEYLDAYDDWVLFRQGDLNFADLETVPSPYLTDELTERLRVRSEGIPTDTKVNVELLALNSKPSSIDAKMYDYIFDGINTISYTPFEFATKNGTSLASSTSITIPASTGYSVSIPANANRIIRFARSQGVTVQYYEGEPTGDLIYLSSFGTLNNTVDSDFVASVEIYNGEPSGDISLSNNNDLSDSFYPNGSFCIELLNNTSEDVTTILSIGIEKGGKIIEPYMIYADLQLTATTEMSDYNGTD